MTRSNFDIKNSSYIHSPGLEYRKCKRESRDQDIDAPVFLSEAQLSQVRTLVILKLNNLDELVKTNFDSIHPGINLQMRAFISQAERFTRITGQDCKPLILEAIRNPVDFAKKLKKQQNLGFIGYHSEDYDISMEIQEDIFIDQKAYDDIFPYDHLPHFAKNECNDYQNYFIKLPTIDSEIELEYKNAFKELLVNFLKRPIKKIHSSEVISAMKGTKIFSSEYKFHGEERIKHPELVSKNQYKLRGVRSVINVGPANVRDSVIWDLASNELIAKSHLTIIDILDQIPYSAMAKTPDKAIRREKVVKRFKNDKYFYVRDFKKSGITFNVKLFSYIYDVLKELFPHSDIEHLRCYSDILITSNIDDSSFGLKKGHSFRPERGHGLGSANALTTLVQCIISQMKRTRLNLSHKEYRSISYNDDLLEKIDKTRATDLKREDIAICNSLGLIIKSQSSGILNGGHVFCEEYESERKYDCNKDVRTLLTISKQLFAPNIFAAKMVVRGISVDDRDSIVKRYLLHEFITEVINYWGYEFVPEECILPDIFGGWHALKNFGIDYGFKRVFESKDEIPSLKVLRKLIEGESETLNKSIVIKKLRNKVKNVESKIGKIWDNGVLITNPDIPTEWEDSMAVLTWDTKKLSNSLYSGIEKRYFPKFVWEDVLKRRLNAYNLIKPPSVVSWEEIYNRLCCISFPNHIAIPRELIDEWDSQPPTVEFTNTISVVGYEELCGEDQFLLKANALKSIPGNENKIFAPGVDEYLRDLEILALEGHILNIAFDETIGVITECNMDDKLICSTYLPQFIASYYYQTYGAIPRLIREGLILPRVKPTLEVYRKRNFSIKPSFYPPRVKRRLLFLRVVVELSYSYGVTNHDDILAQINALGDEESFIRLVGVQLNDMNDDQVIEALIKKSIEHRQEPPTCVNDANDRSQINPDCDAIRSDIGPGSECPGCHDQTVNDIDEADLDDVYTRICSEHINLLSADARSDADFVIEGNSFSIFDEAIKSLTTPDEEEEDTYIEPEYEDYVDPSDSDDDFLDDDNG